MFRYNLPEKYRVINGSTLKIIALITMVIDHFAASVILEGCLMPNAPLTRGTDLWNLYMVYKFLRGVGRIAFPIYVFLLVEGFTHTSNRLKYLARLLIFALISEIPFDLAIHSELWHLAHQNVFFELAACLILLMLWERFEEKPVLRFISFAAIALIAEFAEFDYGWNGVVLVIVLYILKEWRVPQVFFGFLVMSYEFPGVIFGFLPLLFYNEKRGRQLKYFFYASYPVHLFIFYLITEYLRK